MPTLFAVVQYVDIFFTCDACAAHFRNLSQSLQDDVRSMKRVKQPRLRAELWLWQVHNKVNSRLAGEEHGAAFAEHAKQQWPSTTDCGACHDLVEVPHRGNEHHLLNKGWREAQVLAYLHEVYCLEPLFECWEEAQQRKGTLWKHGEVRSLLGTAGILLLLLLLLVLACGCNASNDAASSCCGKRSPRDEKRK